MTKSDKNMENYILKILKEELELNKNEKKHGSALIGGIKCKKKKMKKTRSNKTNNRWIRFFIQWKNDPYNIRFKREHPQFTQQDMMMLAGHDYRKLYKL